MQLLVALPEILMPNSLTLKVAEEHLNNVQASRCRAFFKERKTVNW